MSEEPEKKKEEPYVIRTADLATPPRFPFESRRGVFHPYYYVPFLGWIPRTELVILIVVTALVTAALLPLVRRRKPAAVAPEPAPASSPR